MHSGIEPLRGIRAVAWTGVLALAAACGNYSNDDIIFTEAIPVVGSVQVEVPASTVQPLCAIAGSDLYNSAQQTAAGLNQAIDTVLGWADLIRTFPPSERSTDHRGWGPWPDPNHSGFESKAAMDRTATDRFTFSLYERWIGESDWPILLTASFQGTQPERGSGYLIIHFNVARALGISKPDDPAGDMTVSYDFSTDPGTISLQLGNAGLGLLGADYKFIRFVDGHGTFSFSFADGKGDKIDALASFLASGAGKAVATLHVPTLNLSYQECWDAAACIGYIADEHNLSKVCGNNTSPCDKGDIANCPN
jgi:hypothetical protein